jgi:hypothetical protein
MDSRLHRALIVGSLAACLVVGFLIGLQVKRAHGISAASRIGIALGLLGAVILLAGAARTVLKARQFGHIEARAGWSRQRTSVAAISTMFYAGAAILDLGTARIGSQGNVLLGMGCCFAFMTVYNLARLWRGIEIREGGIVADLTAIPWARVRAYRWDGDDNNKLVLHVRRSLGLLWRSSVGFPIAKSDRTIIHAAMSARFGAPVSVLGRAAG